MTRTLLARQRGPQPQVRMQGVGLHAREISNAKAREKKASEKRESESILT